MRSQTTQFRLTTAIAVTGLVLGPVLPAAGLAQGILPQAAPAPVASEAPGGPEVPPAGPEVTPPASVGRLASMQGTVSFHTADQDSWSPAEVNYPITAGDAFWTQPGGQAGIQVSDTFIGMAPATELDVDTLDNANFAATEPQGELYLDVRDLQPGATYAVQTPRGTVTIATPGRYDIAAGTTDSPTAVTVLDGAAQVSGSAPIDVSAGQTAVISGDQTFQAQLQPAARDEFLNAMLAREQQAPAQRVALPAVVQQMPGASDLAGYGTWSSDPSYGQVWYPQVQSGWVPYREGHWAYVAPWGWTWIDSDPWGFAPFHYGRWVFIGDRWAWVPGGGVVAEAPPYPVYAPALVTFFGIGIGVGIAAAALFQRPICWVPLGPGEPWHPWFRASPNYIRNVNIRNVTNITNITRINNTTVNNITINNFRNARAATVVPASVLATSRSVRDVARPVATTQVAQFRPVVGRQPVRPTTATAGVTPAVARQMHIGAPPPGVAAPPRPRAPGPAIHPRAVALSQPGQRPPAPALHTPQTAGAAPGTPHAATSAEHPAATPHPGTIPGSTFARQPAGEHPAPSPEHPSAAPGATANAHPGAITGSTFTRQPAGEHPAPLLRTPGSVAAGPPPIRHEPGRTATAEPQQTSPSLFNAHPEAPAPSERNGAGRVNPGLAAPAPRPNEAHPTAPALRSPAPAFRPAPQEHAAAPAVVHPAAPPTVHAAPPARVAAPAPRPAPPVVHEAPRPAPAPRPELHAAAPAPRPAPPVVHEAPRPAPPPAPHIAMAPPHAAPAPRPAPAPQQHQEKRPGER